MQTAPQNVLGIILGGGAGTRLYPLTKKRAKPAVPLVHIARLRAACCPAPHTQPRAGRRALAGGGRRAHRGVQPSWRRAAAARLVALRP
jgi:hypothetical protein